MALLTTILCLVITGCFTHREVLYARVTRQKAETQGFMHLAQSTVKVVVQGDATVRDFVPEQTVGAAGYALILDDDLAKLVENTQVLQELSKDPALLAAVRAAQVKVQTKNAGPP